MLGEVGVEEVSIVLLILNIIVFSVGVVVRVNGLYCLFMVLFLLKIVFFLMEYLKISLMLKWYIWYVKFEKILIFLFIKIVLKVIFLKVRWCILYIDFLFIKYKFKFF